MMGEECSVLDNGGEVTGDGDPSSAIERRGLELRRGDEGALALPGDG